MNDRFDEDEPLMDGMPGLPDGVFDGPAPPDAFRDGVWRSTARVVRRRRHYRRAVVACTVAAAYAAGLATTFALYRTPDSALPRSANTALKESVAPEKTEVVSSATPVPEVGLLGDSEALARRISEASHEEQVRLLKQIGDHYLRERGDVQTALNCYRRLLAVLPASERARVDSSDSWLLVALKESRREETNHEKAS